MKIFVSYSFRPENQWIETHVIPLIRCFGHESVTGQILDAGTVTQEVLDLIKTCRRVICFVTRAKPRFDSRGAVIGYDPPDWVRDELIMARGTEREAIEFRELGVEYGGAAEFHAWHAFDRDSLADLMVRLAEVLNKWPVGPLLLRLAVPDALRGELDLAAIAGTLKARCRAFDESGMQVRAEDLQVRVRDDQLTVPFWIKTDPNLSIEIEVDLGARHLACRGISPVVRYARLQVV